MQNLVCSAIFKNKSLLLFITIVVVSWKVMSWTVMLMSSVTVNPFWPPPRHVFPSSHLMMFVNVFICRVLCMYIIKVLLTHCFIASHMHSESSISLTSAWPEVMDTTARTISWLVHDYFMVLYYKQDSLIQSGYVWYKWLLNFFFYCSDL